MSAAIIPDPPPETLRNRIRRHAKVETGPNDVTKSILIELRELARTAPETSWDALAEALPLFVRSVIDKERNRTKSHVPHALPDPDPDPTSTSTTRSRAHMGASKSRRIAARAAWYKEWETAFFNESRSTPEGYKRIGDFTAADWDTAATNHQSAIDANSVGLRQARAMAAQIRKRRVRLTRELPTGDTAEIMAPAAR